MSPIWVASGTLAPLATVAGAFAPPHTVPWRGIGSQLPGPVAFGHLLCVPRTAVRTPETLATAAGATAPPQTAPWQGLCLQFPCSVALFPLAVLRCTLCCARRADFFIFSFFFFIFASLKFVLASRAASVLALYVLLLRLAHVVPYHAALTLARLTNSLVMRHRAALEGLRRSAWTGAARLRGTWEGARRGPQRWGALTPRARCLLQRRDHAGLAAV